MKHIINGERAKKFTSIPPYPTLCGILTYDLHKVIPPEKVKQLQGCVCIKCIRSYEKEVS
jgi:hypothetical protein